MVLNRPQKELKQEGRALLCVISAENVPLGQLKVFTALSMSLNDHESTPNIDWEGGGLQTNFKE